jgi:Zn-finger nucleic acid-binding protein
MNQPEAHSCPKCDGALVAAGPGNGGAVLRCSQCAGIWIAGAELARRGLYEGRDPDEFLDYGKDTGFDCPACPGEQLLEITHGGHVLEWCAECHGLFFDRDEWSSDVPRSAAVNGSRAASFGGVLSEGMGQAVTEVLGNLVEGLLDGLGDAA